MKQDMDEPLKSLRRAIEHAPAFDKDELEAILRQTAEGHGIKPASLIHATRVATTGRAVSPGLFEVLELLGRDRTLARLAAASSLIEAAT
jgi:glutamyl/glutaminyl-tRNA synthetase